jgi:hypothetical protein
MKPIMKGAVTPGFPEADRKLIVELLTRRPRYGKCSRPISLPSASSSRIIVK